jgi:hypothetical protein
MNVEQLRAILSKFNYISNAVEFEGSQIVGGVHSPMH